MASEIRVNSITNRSGLGTVTFSDTGVVLSGVSTFTVSSGSASAPSISPSGDSNTGIFFPSADTIAFAEGGVEALRIDSRSNLGIGTVPQSWSGFRSLQLGGTTSIWSVEGGQSGSSFYSNNIYYDGSNRRYLTSNAASEYIQDASTGNHIFYGVSSGTAGNTLSGYTEFARFTSNGLKLPSGLGIDFSATANSSGTMTSELLSDYEEGTFTPTLLGGATSITLNASVNTLSYTKIGRRVFISGRINIGNLNGATGSLTLGGLPYVSASSGPGNSDYASIRITYYNLDIPADGTGEVFAEVAGGSNALIQYLRDNATWTGINATAMSTSTYLYFTGNYLTTT